MDLGKKKATAGGERSLAPTVVVDGGGVIGGGRSALRCTFHAVAW